MKNKTIESTPVLIGCIVVLSLISCCYSQIGLLPGYYAYTWASGLSGPRQMCTFANGDVLVVQNANNSIALLTDRQNTSRATSMTIVASAPGLRSNIQCYQGYIYAANFTHILRWRYNQGDSAFIPDYDVVIQGIPGEGHSNHPITFDPEGRLYVSLGSNLNLDPTDYRSQIVRTPSPINNTVLPLTWPNDLQLFAGGVRNEAGLRYNRFGELWGVENGMDNLNRTDLAPALVTNNPGEELNLFPDYRGTGSIPIGQFYGYPYCFSEYIINSSLAQGPGAQWYVPGYPPQYTDDWCKNTSNVQPPVFLMPAHTAPLDIVYYEPQAHPFLRGTWPDQDAIYVALHGSWNRTPPSGYRVLKLVLDASRRRVVSSQPFFYFNSTDGTQRGADWQYRPAGVHFGTCGGDDCLLVASDTTGDITAIKFLASVVSPSQTPSSSVGVALPTSSPPSVLSASSSPGVASISMSSMASFSGVSTPSSANSDSSVSASVNPSVEAGSFSSAVPSGSASRMYSSWLKL